VLWLTGRGEPLAPKYIERSTYTSSVIDLCDHDGITSLVLDAMIPPGTGLEVSVRAGHMPVRVGC
jgi:hypothetical protein